MLKYVREFCEILKTAAKEGDDEFQVIITRRVPLSLPAQGFSGSSPACVNLIICRSLRRRMRKHRNPIRRC